AARDGAAPDGSSAKLAPAPATSTTSRSSLRDGRIGNAEWRMRSAESRTGRPIQRSWRQGAPTPTLPRGTGRGGEALEPKQPQGVEDDNQRAALVEQHGPADAEQAGGRRDDQHHDHDQRDAHVLPDDAVGLARQLDAEQE